MFTNCSPSLEASFVHLSFSPPSPPISFSALSNFFEQRSILSSSSFFFFVMASNSSFRACNLSVTYKLSKKKSKMDHHVYLWFYSVFTEHLSLLHEKHVTLMIWLVFEISQIIEERTKYCFFLTMFSIPLLFRVVKTCEFVVLFYWLTTSSCQVPVLANWRLT